ncbi:MAG: WD40 repeat domain-containing protein [Planctomycetaceae bacterium]|nr:WD40 repeat domain-containing protein [Planctomycetaceae bacterium]
MSLYPRMFCLLPMIALCMVPATAEDIDLGLKPAFKSRLVVGSLSNPSGITFSPSGVLTVCDSANGQVLLVKDGKAEPYITGFGTEYWKVDAETGAKRFKLGPLSAVWVNDKTLAVSNGGPADGKENILFFNGPGTADSGTGTNAIGPTTDDPKDIGEGNLIGLSLSEDGSTIYVAGHGADTKTWLLSVDVAAKKLATLISADEGGIETNSPMATLPWTNGTILALYSGAGGKDDGLIVQWNVKTKKVVNKWNLPGLTDPMGMAIVPGSRQLAVVDNNWSLTEVKAGRLAKVNLPKDGGDAKVRVIGENLHGPVSCAFGPDGDLYIAQLGTEFDKDKGQVVAVSGIKAMPKKKEKN